MALIDNKSDDRVTVREALDQADERQIASVVLKAIAWLPVLDQARLARLKNTVLEDKHVSEAIRQVAQGNDEAIGEFLVLSEIAIRNVVARELTSLLLSLVQGLRDEQQKRGEN